MKLARKLTHGCMNDWMDELMTNTFEITSSSWWITIPVCRQAGNHATIQSYFLIVPQTLGIIPMVR
ncbi:MAG: hypothetical protein IID16_06470 [Candidatus Marinimicrobia bacterium]|nr:hypothetical protein [Candidatus Neomarinimicrobiota bacterium]